MTNGSGRRLMDRWIPWIIVILAVAVALSIAANVTAMISNQNRIDDIQAERLRNTITACRERSNQNEQIIAYLEALDARPASIVRAREFFPVLTDEQCVAQARERVEHP